MWRCGVVWCVVSLTYLDSELCLVFPSPTQDLRVVGDGGSGGGG